MNHHNKNGKPQSSGPGYINPGMPPQVEFVDGSPEAEMWLDMMAAAVQGYAASVWTNEHGKLCVTNSLITARNAAEAADLAILAYRRRLRDNSEAVDG